MSEVAPAAPAPAAAEPSAPVAPAPAPAAPAAPAQAPGAQPTSKELANKLYKLLTTPTEESGEPAKKPDDPKPAAEVPKPGDAPKPAADAPKPGIRVSRRKTPEETPPPIPSRRDLIKPAPQPAAPAAPAAPVRTAEEETAAFEKDLVDAERVLLDDARVAERLLGDRYKGHGDKMVAFLREVEKKTSAEDFDENDPAFEQWYQENLPKVSPVDLRQVERARIKEEVTREVEPKIEAEKHTRWVESETPRLKAEGDRTRQELIQGSYPEEVLAAAQDRTKGMAPGSAEYNKAITDVRKEFALEIETAEGIVDAVRDDVTEFRGLTTTNPSTGKRLIEIAPDAQIYDPATQRWVVNPNPVSEKGKQHARLLTMVNELCSEFKATAGANIKRNGKWFATREEWSDMTPEQQKPFWTLSNDELIRFALSKVKPTISATVERKRKYLEDHYGFKRSIASRQPASAPAPSPTPGAPPAPRPSPPPAGGASPAPSLASIIAQKLTSTGGQN